MALPPRVTVAGTETLGSGSVISYGWQPVDIYPAGGALAEPFRIELTFDIKPDQPSAIFANQINQSHIRVRLLNFDRPTGIASSAPIPIASWPGRRLYLSLVVFVVGQGKDQARVTTYTFHQGEQAGG